MADVFYDVLTQAVADISEHGFDSQDRVDYWMTKLRAAAEASLRPKAVLEQRLREAMQALYRKEIERGGILRLHPGVARFTLERVKPQLRAELDRRVMASAQLIRLNREETINKTLRRFSGWATSIPKGGSDQVDKIETKTNVRKALAQLPFEERRVLIDQGHKFTSALSYTIAVGAGAIAGMWFSNFRQAGYDYREDHKERDSHVYAVRGCWALERGLMKAADGYTDDITKPAEEPFCRCKYRWLYNLRDLPSAMLTVKGRAELARVRIA